MDQLFITFCLYGLLAMRQTRCDVIWHCHTPVFHNYYLRLGRRPITYSKRSKKKCLFASQGPCALSDVQQKFNSPRFSPIFLYAALKAYGVP